MFETVLALSDHLNHVHASSGNYEAVSNVCAAAPPGVSTYADQILGWVKWGVLALIVGAGFVSVGAMLVGKFGSNGTAARVGSSGLMWSVIAAIAFVVIYGVLTGITGTGC